MQELVYEKSTASKLLLLPNLYGFLEDCNVYFENAGIHVLINTNGNITFTGESGVVLAETKIKPNADDNRHDGGFCGVIDDKICVLLSIVGLKDTYPNCDGEHDRWVSTIVGYNRIAFDSESGNIEITHVDTVEY